jgi:hypothetical protein
LFIPVMALRAFTTGRTITFFQVTALRAIWHSSPRRQRFAPSEFPPFSGRVCMCICLSVLPPAFRFFFPSLFFSLTWSELPAESAPTPTVTNLATRAAGRAGGRRARRPGRCWSGSFVVDLSPDKDGFPDPPIRRPASAPRPVPAQGVGRAAAGRAGSFKRGE